MLELEVLAAGGFLVTFLAAGGLLVSTLGWDGEESARTDEELGL